jgi:hypothetical protein
MTFSVRVILVRKMTNVYILVGKPRGENHLGDLGVDGRIAVK